MPLSDREQQLLDQMERALLESDPGFATSMRGGPGQARNRRRLAIGVGGVVVGLAVVLLGVSQGATSGIIIGAVGFALMAGAVIYAIMDRRPALHVVPTPGGQGTSGKPGKARRTSSGTSFMDKLEQRWEERRGRGEL